MAKAGKPQVDEADQTVTASSPWDGSRRVFEYAGCQEDPRGGDMHLWTERGRGSTFTDATLAAATAKVMKGTK